MSKEKSVKSKFKPGDKVKFKIPLRLPPGFSVKNPVVYKVMNNGMILLKCKGKPAMLSTHANNIAIAKAKGES